MSKEARVHISFANTDDTVPGFDDPLAGLDEPLVGYATLEDDVRDEVSFPGEGWYDSFRITASTTLEGFQLEGEDLPATLDVRLETGVKELHEALGDEPPREVRFSQTQGATELVLYR